MYKGKKILAVIPARSDSKRIKNKNIIKLLNKPLIQYTLDVAKKCKYIDKIVVSSESKKILKIAKKNGVDTPFLRKEAFDDFTPVDKATLAAVKQSEEYYGNFDIVIQLMPNCPIRSLKTINSSIQNFFMSKKKSQISFFEYNYANPWWSNFIKKGNMHPLNTKGLFKRKRSQDLPKLYCPTGSIWISNVNTLKKYKSFYSPSFGFFILNFIEAIDIDTHEDLKLAKIFYKHFIKKNTIK